MRSADAAGNNSRWKGGFFVTLLRPDDRPPRITEGPTALSAPAKTHIFWKTDELSDSFLQYVPMNVTDDDDDFDIALFDDAAPVFLPELVKSHEIELDVVPGNSYIYRVRSTDASGNSSPFKLGRFRTPAVDDDEPEISGLRVSRRTASQALIKWRTDEGATSRVEYGSSEDYGRSVESLRFVDEHRALLSHLDPQAVYHYRILSADASGNQAVSADNTFITRRKRIQNHPATRGDHGCASAFMTG